MQRISLIVITILLLLPTGAAAHKVKIFAAAKGDVIEGFGYYPGGGKYMNSQVMVFAPRDHQTATINTNTDGTFIYKPTKRCDHLFVIATKDGHRAEFTVMAKNLASTLPDARPTKTDKAKTKQNPNISSSPTDTTEIEKMIDSAVARHIVPLKEDITRYEQRVRLHDIIGGIGYIVGLFGIAAFLLGRKKQD